MEFPPNHRQSTSPAGPPQRPPLDLARTLAGVALLLWAPLLGWDWAQQAFSTNTNNLQPAPEPLPVKLQPLGPTSAPNPGEIPLVSISASLSGPNSSSASPESASLQNVGVSAPPQLQSLPLDETILSEQLQGADGLGGTVSLASLKEPKMPAAAMAERLAWQRSGDPLASLPRHWRDSLRPELASAAKVESAKVVRLPAPHLKQAEAIPLLVRPDGVGEGLASPSSPASKQLVEDWARRQSYSSSEGVRPVLLMLEPIASTASIEPTADMQSSDPQLPAQ